MEAHGTKVQPLSLDSLLELSKQLKTRLRAMRMEGVEQTGPLQELHERCIDAIGQTQIDQRVSTMHSDAK